MWLKKWYERAIARKYLPAQDNLKALEERTKVEQASATPQRRQGAYKMADVIVGAVLLWLILGSDIQPAGSNYTSYAKQALDLQDQDQRDINRIQRDKDPIRR
jgi:hypothetical protein